MKVLSSSNSIEGRDFIMSLAGGILIALCGTFVLSRSYLWACLITVGLAVAVLSLTAKDFKNYWLAVFVLVLPLEIKKMLVDSAYVLSFVKNYGFPVGELPGPVVYLSDLPFMVLLALWIFELLTKKEKLFLPKSNWIAVAFITWSGLSLTKADDMGSAFFDLLRLIKLYVLYLYVANNVRSKETLRTLMKFFLIGVALQGLLCLYQYLAQDIGYVLARVLGQQGLYTEGVLQEMDPLFNITEQGEIRRASGTVGPINSQAQFFEFLLPVALLLWLTVKRCRIYLFYFASFFLGLSGLIVTFSRGGFVGIFIGIAVSLVLAARFGMISKRKLLSFIVLGLGLSIVMAPVVYRFMMTRPEAATARFHLAKVGLKMIGEHPILGVGLNNHVVIKPQYDSWDYVLPMPSHNHYIIIASEVGIPGLLFFLGFLAATCKLALSAARRDDTYLASLAVGIFGGLLAVAVHVMFDILGTHTVMTLIWLYAGLAGAMCKWFPDPVAGVVKSRSAADLGAYPKTL